MSLFEPSFKTFFKSKNLLLYVFSISIAFGLVIAVIYTMILLNNILSENIKNNIINRVIYVSGDFFSDEQIEEIKNLEYVETVYKNLAMGTKCVIEEQYNLSPEYNLIEELPEISNGKVFDNSDEYQVILPHKLYNSGGDYVDLSIYLGEIINIRINDTSAKARVVGTYEKTLGTIYLNEALKNYLVSIDNNIESKNSVIVVADSYKNVDFLIEELKNELNYGANLSNMNGQSDIKLYNLAYLLIVVVLIFSIIFNYVIVSIIISGFINDEKMDIAIFKAIGYKIKDIYKIMKYRILAVMGISFIISIFLAVLASKIIKYILMSRLEIELVTSYQLFTLISLLFIILVYILSKLSVRLNIKKVKKINAIDLLKEN